MASEKSILEYNDCVHKSLMGFCAAELGSTCVKSFRYFRVYENSTYMNLSTNHQWLQERIGIPNNGKAFHKPLCEAVERKYNYYIWKNSTQDPVVQLFKKHDIFNGFSLYKRYKNYVEAWSFGATTNDSNADNYYINNIQRFEDFIDKFLHEQRCLIDRAPVATFQSPVNIAHTTHSSHEEGEQKKGLRDLLTPREREILYLVAHGKTCKEVAAVMDGSPRTVEKHVESMKRKLTIFSKSDLAAFYWKMVE